MDFLKPSSTCYAFEVITFHSYEVFVACWNVGLVACPVYLRFPLFILGSLFFLFLVLISQHAPHFGHSSSFLINKWCCKHSIHRPLLFPSENGVISSMLSEQIPQNSGRPNDWYKTQDVSEWEIVDTKCAAVCRIHINSQAKYIIFVT